MAVRSADYRSGRSSSFPVPFRAQAGVFRKTHGREIAAVKMQFGEQACKVTEGFRVRSKGKAGSDG